MLTLWTLGKVVLSVMFVVAGIGHFVKTDFFVSIMPPIFPWKRALVLLSGIPEVIAGVALWAPSLQALSAMAITAMLVAFVPVHIYMLQDAAKFATIPKPALAARLLFQFVLIGVAYQYTQA